MKTSLSQTKTMSKAFYYIHVTDRYNSWYENYCVEATEQTVVKRAKQEIGWSGKRCTRYDKGDFIELRLRGDDVIAVIEKE
jgi:hypothetical protein